jgi:hypothetical protein
LWSISDQTAKMPAVSGAGQRWLGPKSVGEAATPA